MKQKNALVLLATFWHFYFDLGLNFDSKSIFLVSIQQLGTLREQAKAITNMAATVPYRMPGDISSRLVQTEILMH